MSLSRMGYRMPYQVDGAIFVINCRRCCRDFSSIGSRSNDEAVTQRLAIACRMRPVRKVLRSLLLLLALLVSQQGALLHELSHLSDASAPATSNDGKAHLPCETCLSFAHIVGVVHSSEVAPALLATAEHWVGAQTVPSRGADAPAHAARDPPSAG